MEDNDKNIKSRYIEDWLSSIGEELDKNFNESDSDEENETDYYLPLKNDLKNENNINDNKGGEKYKILLERLRDIPLNEGDMNFDEDKNILNLKDLSRSLVDKVERIPIFEEKIGIKYENISFILNEINSEISMQVVGDIFEVDREKIEKNTSIYTHVTIYDNENFILFTSHDSIYSDDFLGFTNFSIYVGKIDINEISRIRIYPE